jgi:hypothetical protein
VGWVDCSVSEHLGGGADRDGAVEPVIELQRVSAGGDLLTLFPGRDEVPGIEEPQDSLGLAFCFAFGDALVVDSLHEGPSAWTSRAISSVVGGVGIPQPTSMNWLIPWFAAQVTARARKSLFSTVLGSRSGRASISRSPRSLSAAKLSLPPTK